MTVREAVNVLKDAKKIYIGWDGLCKELDTNSDLDMDAYGKYIVKSIVSYNKAEGSYEVAVAMRPLSE